MRGDYFKFLTEAMRKDEKIFFLMGDTGFNLVEPLFEEFPDRKNYEESKEKIKDL